MKTPPQTLAEIEAAAGKKTAGLTLPEAKRKLDDVRDTLPAGVADILDALIREVDALRIAR